MTEEETAAFDPNRPFRTRDGREIRNFRIGGNAAWRFSGYVVGDKGSKAWKADGRYILRDLVQDRSLDLVNVTPHESVEPTIRGAMPDSADHRPDATDGTIEEDPGSIGAATRGATDIVAGLRDAGWCVAVHNDYRLNGERRTFWLFTHADGRWIKGEGTSDRQALEEALQGASRPNVATEADRDPRVTETMIDAAWRHVPPSGALSRSDLRKAIEAAILAR